MDVFVAYLLQFAYLFCHRMYVGFVITGPDHIKLSQKQQIEFTRSPEFLRKFNSDFEDDNV